MRLIALAFTITALAVTAVPCQAAGLRVEVEDLTTFYNYSGTTIGTVSCSGASGQFAIQGVDFPGEWIEIPFTLTSTVAFVDSLRSSGYTNERRQFSVHFISEGNLQSAPGDTTTTGLGLGFG